MMHIALVVICSLVLSFLAAVGVNIQKLSMNRERRRCEENDQEEVDHEEEEVDHEADEERELQGLGYAAGGQKENAGGVNGDVQQENSQEGHVDEQQVELEVVQIITSNHHEEPPSVSPGSTRPRHHRPRPRPRPPFKQPLWCLGMSVIIADAIGDFIFIGLAPQTLLAPLGSLSLGWNVVLAPIFNPTEKVTKQIILATVVIYVGTILTVLFASDTSPTYQLSDIVNLWQNQAFIIYISVCVILQITTLIHGYYNNTSTSTTYYHHGGRYSVLHYCSLAGCFGGQSILLAKSSSELLKDAIVRHDLQDWTNSILPYLFLLGMVVCLLLQFVFLNTGLEKFDALIVVPLYQSFWTIFAITGGLIFFQEHKQMTQLDAIMYAIGIGITFIGIYLFTISRTKRDSSSLVGDGDYGDYDDHAHETSTAEFGILPLSGNQHEDLILTEQYHQQKQHSNRYDVDNNQPYGSSSLSTPIS